MIALLNVNSEVARWLVENGADVNRATSVSHEGSKSRLVCFAFPVAFVFRFSWPDTAKNTKSYN